MSTQNEICDRKVQWAAMLFLKAIGIKPTQEQINLLLCIVNSHVIEVKP
jgi:hypothetical protein